MATCEDLNCAITFYTETPTKIRQINPERNYLSRSCEKSKCILSNDRHNCFIDEQHNSNIFLNPYSFWDIISAALISLSHASDRYSMSNQYPQPKTHQPRTDSYPVFSSLRRMDSQGKGLRVSFAFFQRNYLPDGRVNETVATVEELDFRRLWWTVIVFKSSHMFYSFDFFCLLVQYLLFFRKFTFFVHFDDFELEVKLHR